MKNLPSDWNQSKTLVQPKEVLSQPGLAQTKREAPKGFIGFKIVLGFLIIWAGLIGLAYLFPNTWVAFMWMLAPLLAGPLGMWYMNSNNPNYKYDSDSEPWMEEYRENYWWFFRKKSL